MSVEHLFYDTFHDKLNQNYEPSHFFIFYFFKELNVLSLILKYTRTAGGSIVQYHIWGFQKFFLAGWLIA